MAQGNFLNDKLSRIFFYAYFLNTENILLSFFDLKVLILDACNYNEQMKFSTQITSKPHICRISFH